jgi:hypothetical protein
VNKNRNLSTTKPQHGLTPANTTRTGSVWNTVSTASNRPQNGWNSVEPSATSTTARGSIPQSQKDRLKHPRNSAWGRQVQPPPPPPPLPSFNVYDGSPSSDWRHHTMSPRTPSSSGNSGRSIRKTPMGQNSQQQFWPSLSSDPPLPNKTSNKPKSSGEGTKLQGVWVNRKK